MVALPPPPSPTVDAIFASYEARQRQARRRDYLGGSELGRECSRELWYRFRWALRPSFGGRILRLFDTGHREEPRLIEELRRIGVEVLECDVATKRQYRFEAFGGHLAGHIDGVARKLLEAPKTWHLLEFKTSNFKAFRKLVKEGVERTKPEHFGQMQAYMGLAKLTRAAYFSVCKDNDDIYLERVHFDRKFFEQLLERARQVIESPEPLTRVSGNAEIPPCKFCDYRETCHESEVADVNCRTCVHSTPVIDGTDATWRCEKRGKALTLTEQEKGCDEHLLIPPLVPFADAIDGGPGFVLYQIRHSGQRFANVAAAGFPAKDVPHYSSRQLKEVPPNAIGDAAVEAAREVFSPEVARVPAYEMRAACVDCGGWWGEVERKNGQDVVRCECGRYQYNAPRAEVAWCSYCLTKGKNVPVSEDGLCSSCRGR